MEPEEVLEQEVLQEEPVVETPAENVQEPVAEPKPVNVRTGGKWVLVEEFLSQKFEIGKTYHIKVKGNCEFMISKDEPTMGIKTNEITFKKETDVNLWIKTGV